MALGVLLQHATGMRTGECITLLPEHVLLPEEQAAARRGVPTVLALV